MPQAMPGVLLDTRAQDWLRSCAPDPAAVSQAWDLKQFAEIPTGRHWRVVEAPLVESVAAIRRLGPEHIGPILADVHRDAAWWLVRPDLGDRLVSFGPLNVRPAGWLLACPPVLFSLDGRWWLERPDGSGRLTDPVLLGAAFGPGDAAPFATEASR